MLTAPLRWVVQAIVLLPDLLRPGVFLALLVLLGWFVFVQRGLPHLWAATCRGAARVADRAIGLLLLPQHLLATARRRGGQAVAAGGGRDAPPPFDELADRALDGVAALYASHRREPLQWRRPPWKACALLVAVCAGAWLAMDGLPADSDARRELAGVYDRWRDVEAWAGVDRTRRAAPGVRPPVRPGVVRERRLGGTLGVRLRCSAASTCRGRVVVRSRSGRRLAGRPVGLAPRSTKVVSITLPATPRIVRRRARVVVLRPRADA